MWTSTIQKKDFDNGFLRVIVGYTNGTDSFEESYMLRTGKELDNYILNRKDELTQLDTVNIPIGEYTPTPKVAVPAPFDVSIGRLAEVKRLIGLGVLNEQSPEYLVAVAEAQSEYQKI